MPKAPRRGPGRPARESVAAGAGFTLRELREKLGKRQADVAEAMGAAQSRVSEAELPGEHKLSTIRAYVEALGGELELVAKLRGGRVTLRGL